MRRLAVLYADIAGSTRLYEEYGDEIARGDTSACLEILSNVAAQVDGQTIKTIGDEIMCLFPTAAKAAVAASEMQLALREASAEGRFRTGPLRIKIGWHLGLASWDDGELRGEAPILAQQVIKMAKPDEVLASGQSLAALPEGLKHFARFVDRVEAETGRGEIDIHELPWEEADELTSVASQATSDNAIVHTELVIKYRAREFRLGAERPHFKMGRSDECDLTVNGNFASRVHAHITFRHARFHLSDNSTNGTTIVASGGEFTTLHREEEMLAGSGSICLGSTPAEDPEAVVEFCCQ